MQDKIDIQRKKILKGNPTIDLSDSCRIGNGISQISEENKSNLLTLYKDIKSSLDICFFIPASGSGSRMFSALYEFLNDPANPDVQKSVDEFVAHIEEMAIYYYLSDEWKEKISENNFDKVELVEYLLTDAGLDLGGLPKGLIPFHIYENYITNPFQEHLVQGTQIGDTASKFHFTINKRFEDRIDSRIKKLERRLNMNFVWEFSEQDPSTNSVAFTDDMEPAVDGQGMIITRPAGHGTLIKNLNTIDADIIFIRNIDNMQHGAKADTSTKTRQLLAGVLLDFQSKIHNILKKVERGDAFASSMSAFNKEFDMRIPQELIGDEDFVKRYFDRPVRVCGMVKNEGAPGGGPFWVKMNGNETRQIIEKSQISNNPEQKKLMETATHFNPVELVCGVRNHKGQKFDLEQYVDENQYFIVNKTQEGQAIKYIEQPGLWNGAMAHWLTLFYEIDSACFSPVKTVMDLLKPAHRSS